MSRTLVIGDIHGALRALEDLLAKLSLEDDDRLIFLGDYVDGWSESAAVLEYLIRLNQRQSCLFIKGNHDLWCEEWLEGKFPDPAWIFHGGLATLESYIETTPEMRLSHLEFLQKMVLYHVDEENRLFVHAGFSSMKGPHNERFPSTFTWDRTLLEMAVAMDGRMKPISKRYPKRLQLFKEIFIGHTPTTNYDKTVPMRACNVWDVDTGAAFLGRLSALDIDTKEFWQSEVVQTLYPLEKGRNP
ncbi:MAG TPA: metallophosphoesterase [Dinghuibacter sp.]|uniref:metallophosphoesterase n=1 Tax=Dinghuibacter sp. TaxID=2024697 RepID=UPI002CD32459|nr:metallophosphoesterase [Dinghuibacter sp.]HTJ12839.1 metallophosphoesterase [Dinghuibacter sp.]